jgi:hypothetical protein
VYFFNLEKATCGTKGTKEARENIFKAEHGYRKIKKAKLEVE